jgi:murein DD-endopeptidase MepM/ murein hydrolase activator NlpD
MGLLAAGLCSAPAAGQSGEGESEGPPVAVEWRPESPAQGRLFAIRVSAPAGAIQRVEGRSAGERLHFREVEPGVLEALVPVPLDAGDEARVDLEVTRGDGARESVRQTIPVTAGSYRHERLTVAPRFGRPPTPEESERRARDVAKARAVSEAAHRTSRLWTEDMVIPRDDRVTSEFGNGREFNGEVTGRHMGLDLDGEPGDTVRAAARGVVELVDEFALAGNIVYLNHGAGVVSGYFHLSRQLVEQGDTVQAGTPIGLVGATGRVTGPHLHWVVRYGHVTVDPRSLLEAAGTR